MTNVALVNRTTMFGLEMMHLVSHDGALKLSCFGGLGGGDRWDPRSRRVISI